MARLVFLTCHLTGTGHHVRTLTLARAALARGHDVTVITGGRPLAHINPGALRLIQLPPVTVSDFDFGRLRTLDGEVASEAFLERRRRTLTDYLSRHAPEVLVTELFPFGRRMLAAEFLGAIATARRVNQSALVLCSVRDVPEPKPNRLAEAAERLRTNYDGVLIHGDSEFLALDVTWPLPGDLQTKLHYTGYVGRPMPDPPDRREDVLVSTGGGVLGRRLLKIAAQAARLSRYPWHILIGGADAADVAAKIDTEAPAPNLVVEPARPDYRALLAGAGCSVSLAGYNTAVELASCQTPALLVPSEEAGEQEQLIRARRLATSPGIALCRLAELTPGGLAEIADALVFGPRRLKIPLTLDDGTAAITRIEILLSDRPR